MTNDNALTKKMRQNPDGYFWETKKFGKPPARMTVKDIFDAFLKGKDWPTWRKYRVSRISNWLSPVLHKKVARLTNAHLLGIIDKSSAKNPSRLTDQLTPILRFVIEGKEPWTLKNRTAVDDPNKSTIAIKEHQIIDEAEALALISRSKGRHQQFREELVKKLRETPEGKSYIFRPSKLSSDAAQQKKEIGSLKHTVGLAIKTDRLKFSWHYLREKNIFVFLHASTNGSKPHASKAATK